MKPPPSLRTQRRRWRRWLRRVLGASAAAAALHTHPAVARDFLGELEQGSMAYGAGLFFGYQFGPRASIEWGLEAFATHRFSGTGCTSNERFGVGPLLQIGIQETHDPRLTLALNAGGELSRSVFALSGELGLTYRFGAEPGFGIHLGVVPETAFANAALRYQLLRQELWLGGGLRFLPTYGAPGFCAVGRPLRFAGQRAGDSFVPAADGGETRPATAASLAAEAYARDAQLESASVLAFTQLAGDLLAQGAPETLIERALDAACDEIVHAELCAELATRGLGQRVRPVLPEAPARPALRGEAGFLRLACESWVDGCLAEGFAAEQAASAARLAADSCTSRVQHQIAADERRHAELAWSILDWSLREGGPSVQRALRALSTVRVAGAAPDSGLERFGRLGSTALVRLEAEHSERSQARLEQALA